MNLYQPQWEHLELAWRHGRLPQAMLFVGALDCALSEFIKNFMRLVFCKHNVTTSDDAMRDEPTIVPCMTCVDCHMVARAEHPDIEWIRPEKNSGPIKIDQIRELQNYSYLTPQRSSHRLIIIESAHRMNVSAGNALLKILEEPASHTLFLLIAQQLSTVLPTILSRCQLFRFSSPMDFSTINLLKLGERYPQDSEQMMIINHAESILEGLIAVLEKKAHPCVMAAQWIQFELNTLLWFFYLVYSQIQMMWINKSNAEGLATPQLHKLAELLNPIVIFSQIDKINLIQRKLNHNLNVNSTLVLEDLLMNL